jgi:hypothetical protein
VTLRTRAATVSIDAVVLLTDAVSVHIPAVTI